MKATIILSICALILFAHCQTNPTPSIKTQDSIEIVTDTMNLDLHCYPSESIFQVLNGVFNDSTDFYDKVLINLAGVPDCINKIAPKIDFNKHTLLFQNFIWVRKGFISQTVIKYKYAKKIVYKLEIPYRSDQKGIEGVWGPIFMLIPKVPADYTVDFDTTMFLVN
ncbi:MAG: hypothetical protein NT007_15740 [Candidatus Kapabacteria bacterium]|nr:hypothetical protein [Candidatus Kapabacteria bacterium]